MTYLPGTLPSTAEEAKKFVEENPATWAMLYKRWVVSTKTKEVKAVDSVRAFFEDANKRRDEATLNLLEKRILQNYFQHKLSSDPLKEIFARNSKEEPWYGFYAIVDTNPHFRVLTAETRRGKPSLSTLIETGRAIIDDKKKYPDPSDVLQSPTNKLAFLAAIADAQYTTDSEFLKRALTSGIDINAVFGENTKAAAFVRAAAQETKPAAVDLLFKTPPTITTTQTQSATPSQTLTQQKHRIQFNWRTIGVTALAAITTSVLAIAFSNPFANTRTTNIVPSPSQAPTTHVAKSKTPAQASPPMVTKATNTQTAPKKITPVFVSARGLDDAIMRLFTQNEMGVKITDGSAARQRMQLEKKYSQVDWNILQAGTSVSLQEKNSTHHLLIIGVNREIYSVPVNEEIATQFKKPEAKQISGLTQTLTDAEKTDIAFQFKAHQARG
jgi:hypothetical protein